MATAIAALVCLLLVQPFATSANECTLKIAAFNVKILGATKANKPVVMADLAKIINEFDITLVQEIREVSSSFAIDTLRDKLNANHGNKWVYNQSAPLGRSSAKEEYAYMYRTDCVKVKKIYQYNDTVLDEFEREPYGVLIEMNGTELGLLGIHVKPSTKSEDEIHDLVKVYDDARLSYNLGTNNIWIIGDFNADCSYVVSSDWSDIALWTDTRFKWHIDNDADTTVKTTTNCSYDRIVSAGNHGLVDGGGHVYVFDSVITTADPLDVSDHYPVYAKLQKKSDDGKKPKIGAFRITIFGVTKAGKPEVMKDIAKIINAFDITFIQDTRESNNDTAIKKLTALLNNNHGSVWNYVESDVLGTGAQYAYMYKNTSVKILKTYQYNDSVTNYFDKEPFGVLAEIHGFQMGLFGIHIKFDNAVSELRNLHHVYDDAKLSSNLGTDNIMILGDFNAGCSSVPSSAWSTIPIWTDTRFTWLISDSQDTSVATGDCPYDRIVIAGSDLSQLVNSTGHVYYFDEILGLSDDEAANVSGNYPVCATMDGKYDPATLNLKPYFSFTVSTPSSLNLSLLATADTVFSHEEISSTHHFMQADINCDNIETELDNLMEEVPGSVTPLLRYLRNSYMTTLTFPDICFVDNVTPDTCSVDLEYMTGNCTVSISLADS